MDNNNMVISLFGFTDMGMLRKNNEDNFIVGDLNDRSEKAWTLAGKSDHFAVGENGQILMVADGMGGENAGEVASEIAVNSIKEFFNKPQNLSSVERICKTLDQSIMSAHRKILSAAAANPEREGMGTTATVAYLKNNYICLSWSGDSRCYLYNDHGGLTMLSSDHSMVWDLVKSGQITPEIAAVHPDRNLITQNLGDTYADPKPESAFFTLSKGDRILLCSDGLNSMLSDSEIADVLKTRQPVRETCKMLIKTANQAGGEDNITVVLADILEIGKGSQSMLSTMNKTGSTSTSGSSKLTKYLILLLLLIVLVLSGVIYLNSSKKQPVNPQPIKTTKIIEPIETSTEQLPEVNTDKGINPVDVYKKKQEKTGKKVKAATHSTPAAAKVETKPVATSAAKSVVPAKKENDKPEFKTETTKPQTPSTETKSTGEADKNPTEKPAEPAKPKEELK